MKVFLSIKKLFGLLLQVCAVFGDKFDPKHCALDLEIDFYDFNKCLKEDTRAMFDDCFLKTAAEKTVDAAVKKYCESSQKYDKLIDQEDICLRNSSIYSEFMSQQNECKRGTGKRQYNCLKESAEFQVKFGDFSKSCPGFETVSYMDCLKKITSKKDDIETFVAIAVLDCEKGGATKEISNCIAENKLTEVHSKCTKAYEDKLEKDECMAEKRPEVKTILDCDGGSYPKTYADCIQQSSGQSDAETFLGSFCTKGIDVEQKFTECVAKKEKTFPNEWDETREKCINSDKYKDCLESNLNDLKFYKKCLDEKPLTGFNECTKKISGESGGNNATTVTASYLCYKKGTREKFNQCLEEKNITTDLGELVYVCREKRRAAACLRGMTLWGKALLNCTDLPDRYKDVSSKVVACFKESGPQDKLIGYIVAEMCARSFNEKLLTCLNKTSVDEEQLWNTMRMCRQKELDKELYCLRQVTESMKFRLNCYETSLKDDYVQCLRAYTNEANVDNIPAVYAIRRCTHERDQQHDKYHECVEKIKDYETRSESCWKKQREQTIKDCTEKLSVIDKCQDDKVKKAHIVCTSSVLKKDSPDYVYKLFDVCFRDERLFKRYAEGDLRDDEDEDRRQWDFGTCLGINDVTSREWLQKLKACQKK